MPDEVHKFYDKINTILADNAPQYWALVKKWLTCSYSYEELDLECQKLFPTPDDILLHTNFVISLKNRLSVPPNTNHTKSQKRRSRKSKKHPIFQPAEIYDYIPNKENKLKPILYSDGSVHTQTYATEELFLPDKCMVLGRLLIAAWQNEVADVNDTVADLIVQATKIFIKNVLTAIITSNRSYKRYDEYFKHSIGVDVPDPFIPQMIEASIRAPHYGDQPSVKMIPNLDKEDQLAILNSSFNKRTMKKQRITVDQVYDVLKLNHNIIPNHSVYSLAVEQAALEFDDDSDDQLRESSVFNYKKLRTY